MTLLLLMKFQEVAYICVQDSCCHPGGETLALLDHTSQWLASSGWPAGKKTALVRKALGVHQGKFRDMSTACAGRTHDACVVHHAGFKRGC